MFTAVNVVLVNHTSSGWQQGADGKSLIPTTKNINRKLQRAKGLCVSHVKVSF